MGLWRTVTSAVALGGLVAIAAVGSGQSPDTSIAALVRSRTELVELYRPGGFAPLWVNGDGRLSDAAHDALRLLEFSTFDGLNPDDYDSGALRTQAAVIERGATADSRSRFDVALSTSVLAYLHHLRAGRTNPQRQGVSSIDTGPVTLAAQLRDSIASRQVVGLVRASRPRDSRYALLAASLERYRRMQTLDVPPLAARKTSVRPGDRFDDLATLWTHLVAEGDAAADALQPSGDRHEGVVVDAVTRFQRRHGLEPDGVLGRSTFAELMVPLSWRVRQIELAMERMRWLPRQAEGQRLLIVNIPMFTLSAWEAMPPSGAPAFSTRVIVGKAKKTETPQFEAVLGEILFRPYWNVPVSILRGEVLPTLARQPDYLTREQMELVAGEMDNSPVVPATPENLALLKQGRVRLRQRPGPMNALGLIKFSFPNPFDVYMHATPTPALFARSRRDFSHGCVRVQNPVGLATWLLAEQPPWSRDLITGAMTAPQPSRVKLDRPARVILSYSTVEMSMESGETLFAPDIYGLDVPLDRAMREK